MPVRHTGRPQRGGRQRMGSRAGGELTAEELQKILKIG
jgi:hypothetical protein